MLCKLGRLVILFNEAGLGGGEGGREAHGSRRPRWGLVGLPRKGCADVLPCAFVRRMRQQVGELVGIAKLLNVFMHCNARGTGAVERCEARRRQGDVARERKHSGVPFEPPTSVTCVAVQAKLLGLAQVAGIVGKEDDLGVLNLGKGLPNVVLVPLGGHADGAIVAVVDGFALGLLDIGVPAPVVRYAG